MAWTSPPTYTDGQIIAAADLDIISNNFNELALHDHSGGSGSGTRSLGGSATGLISVYMRDGAGPGTPTGTISAVFTTGSRLAMHSSGGTVVLFATSGHEHSVTAASTSGTGSAVFSGTATTSTLTAQHGSMLSSAAFATSTSTAFAIAGSGKRGIVYAGHIVWINTTATNSSATFKIERDGTVLHQISDVSISATVTARLQFIGLDADLASGTYTYAISGRAASTGHDKVTMIYSGLSLFQISVP